MLSTEGLNDKQKEAVLATEGPLLIIAGAGAGKTKVITHRILRLIENGVEPREILAITFTNKAAREMNERVNSLLAEAAHLNRPITFGERPFVATFHALGATILRENSRLVGLPKHFAIFDKEESRALVRESLKEAGYDVKQYEPGRILGMISKQKSAGVSLEKYREHSIGEFYPSIAAAIWQRYQKKLADEKAVDFDDLLSKTLSLLKNPEVLSHYHKRWRYIEIDEYQDTNKIQSDIAILLAGKSRNICAVGDIDQSIYGWRGADIENILRFEEIYPEAKIILLEQNYRSTKTILRAANNVITKNKLRRDKNLFTQNSEGEQIILYGAYDEADEAGWVAEKSRELIAGGTPAREIAVLYRANFQSRALEEAYLNAEVPYQVLGTRFFERSEIKDVVSYLRLSLAPQEILQSLSDLKRALNSPPRGIGRVGLLKIIQNQSELLPSAAKKAFVDFQRLLADISEKIRNLPPSNIVGYVVEASGLKKTFDHKGEEGQERLENLKELVAFAKRYDHIPLGDGLERFLTDAALASEADSEKAERDGVRLMTAHASKGLEFDCVFVTGLEDGLFPHERDEESESDKEEERRLFYVAVTRARRRLFLSYASLRSIFGSRKVSAPSPFIFDIDEGLITLEESRPEKREKTIYFD